MNNPPMKSLLAGIAGAVLLFQPLGVAATSSTVPSISSPCALTRAEDILWVQDFELPTSVTSRPTFTSSSPIGGFAGYARDNRGIIVFDSAFLAEHPEYADGRIDNTAAAAAFSGGEGLILTNPNLADASVRIYDEGLTTVLVAVSGTSLIPYTPIEDGSVALVEPGSFRVSFWARTTAPRATKVLFGQSYSSDAPFGETFINPQWRVISPSWSCVSVDFEIPADFPPVNYLRTHMLFGSLQPGYEIHVDDYAITRR